ncbi:MAG: cell division protein FtsA [Candidatus Liptonbacteria bacterium]|nr:cell division protein FtsA [Candidatus Liptonbacteria bacterium]
MSSNFVVGLDIGTSVLKAAVAEIRDGKPVLRAVFKEPAVGLRKGVVIEMGEVSPAVGRLFSEIKKNYKHGLKSVYVNIGTPQVKVQNSRGIVPISRADSEIYAEDVEKVVNSSQAINLATNRLIIHNVTREFIVDGVGDITEPIGLSGSRLEVSSLIIDVFAPHVKSVIRAVEIAGGKISGVVFNPLLASRAALSKMQKDLGVIIIDVGFGTTGYAVFEENKLVATGLIPLGAGNITNDIAIGLKINATAAENLKLHYGYALEKEVGSKETIELKKFSSQERGIVSRRFVVGIIESRLAEILEFIDNDLRSIGKAGKLAGGAVLAGGGAKIPGLTELAKQELKLSSQIGLTIREEWGNEGNDFADVFEDPQFVNSLGLILWAYDGERHRQPSAVSDFKFRNLLKYFIP